MQALLDGQPLGAAALDVALVERHRDVGQLDLADEPVERRVDGRPRMAEPLRRPDEPAQVVEAQARLDGRRRRVDQQAVPAAHQRARRPGR